MDDLKKQRIKRIDNDCATIVDGFINELNKLNHLKLTKRKNLLQDKIVDPDLDEITTSNARLQLQEIEASLTALDKEIDWNLIYDTDVDEEAARRLIKRHNILEEGESLIKQNDTLDKLEKELYSNTQKGK